MNQVKVLFGVLREGEDQSLTSIHVTQLWSILHFCLYLIGFCSVFASLQEV